MNSITSPSRIRRLCGLLLATAFFLPPLALGQGAGFWHTNGSQILDANNQRVRIAGINWYGFETSSAVANGLYAQDYKVILQSIHSNGYNTVRIPFSNQMVETPGTNLNVSYSNSSGPINTDLQGLNSLQVLDKIVSYAGTLGLRIILDNHRSEAGNSAEANGLWYTGSYPESSWINDWKSLAQRYNNNPTVIGFDLRNEPHNAYSGGACWDCGGANDWHLAAARAGNAALSVNPNLLIFVEGVDAYNNDYYWWGGNLEGVRNSPVTLSIANKLVYSAHDYGPHEYGQSWFNGNTTYSSLSTVWNNHWGYIVQNNIAPVWLGEFGTTNTTSDIQNNAAGSQGQWFQSMIQYLAADPYVSWTYWALNGEDAYGLLDSSYDPTPVNPLKQQDLASIQFQLSSGSSTSTPPATPTGLAATATSASQIQLTWSPSSSAGVTYTVFSGTSSGATNTVVASGVNSTSYAATGLTASTTYYFTIKAVSAGGTSGASNQASATTQPATGTSAPANLVATAASSTQIGLTWNASTTSGATYSVYSGTTAGAASNLLASGISGTSYQATGLQASTTYYFVVKAVAGGTASPASNQASATTTTATTSSAACHISYVDQNDWGVGFTGGISISNTSTTPLTSWKLQWTFAGTQQLNQSWNGSYAQSGKNVTITNASWNGNIPAGSTVSGIGFNANYSGANTYPTTFYLNGVLCR
jgi:endoglucanase